MVTTSNTRLGGCSCGSVRFAVTGKPLRVGLCHCKSCRKETGSVAMAYAVWDTAQFSTGGETRTWEGRDFCPRCGTRLYSLRAGEHEVEIKFGALDVAPTTLVPTEEIWTRRREPWLQPVAGAKQYEQDVELEPVVPVKAVKAAAKRPVAKAPAKKVATKATAAKRPAARKA